jgi:hypothetical protein
VLDFHESINVSDEIHTNSANIRRFKFPADKIGASGLSETLELVHRQYPLMLADFQDFQLVGHQSN